MKFSCVNSRYLSDLHKNISLNHNAHQEYFLFMEKLDKSDKNILSVLQNQGRITNQELAEKVNLSAAACWRRLEKIENSQLIHQYVALVDREQIGLSVMVYVHIRLNDHHNDTVDEFDHFVEKSNNILECYSVSGEYDYLVKIVAKNVHDLELFLMKKLLANKSVGSANTNVVLKQKKYTTALPLGEV